MNRRIMAMLCAEGGGLPEAGTVLDAQSVHEIRLPVADGAPDDCGQKENSIRVSVILAERER